MDFASLRVRARYPKYIICTQTNLGACSTGGTTVGILADNLLKASVNSKYRPHIRDGRLTLISTYDPNAGFNVGNAMGRNKYVYSMANYVLIVNSAVEKRGTWAGAIKALDKIKDIPVFVRMQGIVSEGNQQLLKPGAKSFPEIPLNQPLKELLVTAILPPTKTVTLVSKSESKEQSIPSNIYDLILPLILHHLDKPKDAKTLSESLDVQLVQMQDWLNRAVEEGKIRKNKKPVTYEINHNGSLLSLLETDV